MEREKGVRNGVKFYFPSMPFHTRSSELV